jgi:predicted transposase YbfD/YdcC
VATTVDKAHGRLEKRTLRTTAILTLHHRWPGMKQGFEVTRERTAKGEKEVEVAYGITSLGPEQADARRLLGLVRDHWRVENCSHYVRDVTLKEDACRVRSGNAPQVLAALRNTVIHLLREVPAESRPAAIEHLSTRPNQALELIGLSPVE